MKATDCERYLSHGRLSPAQTERAVAPEKVLKIVSCGCRMACSKTNLAKLDYIVQRCALFVLAKHVETVRVRMIETEPKPKQL